MTRCATLMPSPMMFIWPFRSFTRRTGPRLMPRRTGTVPAPSRTVMAANSASSGSPMKVTAAPSPVSRMMRSRTATCSSAVASALLNACLSCICSATGFFEYSTMSRKSTLQTSVRPEFSMGSFYAHARLRPAVGRQQKYTRRVAGSGEHHALGDAEFHGTGRKIGHHHHQPPLELRRVVGGLDAGQHRPRRSAHLESQAQELVRPFDLFGFCDLRHAQVELVEIVDRNRAVAHGGFLGRFCCRLNVEQRIELLFLDARDEVFEGPDGGWAALEV